MKKTFMGILAVMAIVVIGLSIKNNIESQPALVIQPNTQKIQPVSTTTIRTETPAGPKYGTTPATSSKGTTVTGSTTVTSPTTISPEGANATLVLQETPSSSHSIFNRKKDDRPYCTVNGTTINYGYQHWHGWWIFGGWTNIPNTPIVATTASAAQSFCNNFLYGTPNQPGP